jgi:hypothetical protein
MVRFVWTEGVPGSAIHRMVSMQCCDPTNKLRDSKMVVQALSVGMEPDWQLKERVNAWLVPQHKTFYYEGI